MWYETNKYPRPHELADSALNYLITKKNVAWVSTVDEQGRANLAPFSYFAALSSHTGRDPCPELVMISCVKDCAAHTLRNIKHSRQLVINGVDDSIKNCMYESGSDIEPSETEFKDLGVTAGVCKMVKPPRVLESQWSLECELVETREYDGGTTMVVAKVMGTHIKDVLCTPKGIEVQNHLHGPTLKDPDTNRPTKPKISGVEISKRSTQKNVELLKALGEREYNLPETKSSARWIRERSGLAWLELDMVVPYADMIREWEGVKHRATKWSRGDAWHGMETHGWKSLTMHGLSADSHERQPYGASMNKWTEIAEQCPITKRFLESNFHISSSSGAIRFLLLEPGGYIVPHSDQKDPGLKFCNIGLDVPKGTNFYMENHGNMPYKSGSCLIWDHSIKHWVVNDSNRPRLNISVVAHVRDDVLVKSYNRYKNYQRQVDLHVWPPRMDVDTGKNHAEAPFDIVGYS